jgi:hypothetical protein
MQLIEERIEDMDNSELSETIKAIDLVFDLLKIENGNGQNTKAILSDILWLAKDELRDRQQTEFEAMNDAALDDCFDGLMADDD